MVIRVEKLSKRYELGMKEPYFTVSDFASNLLRRVLGRHRTKERKYIWALKDVSFSVSEGEIVGIIGKNGAGKTTLLKILSRITYPTEGIAVVEGRVGSLLEVGIGFHPELTGRENVFLYGAILGMSRKEIERKFDEIVAFAELEKFIDTPVKYYSSGMYVRLAFSVAAHLETDILLVDEVLAVGDVGFQKKSFGKMQELRKTKRTILVVSHNMDAISRLCTRAILLDRGRLIVDGDVKTVIEEYLKGFGEVPAMRTWDISSAPGDSKVKLVAVRLKDRSGNIKNSFDIRKPVIVEIDYRVLESTNACANFQLYNEMGVLVFATGENSDISKAYKVKEPGLWRAVCEIPGNLLADGRYIIRVIVISPRREGKAVWHVDVPEAVSFYVYDPLEGDSARGDWGGKYPGIVMPKLNWESFRLNGNFKAEVEG